MIAQLKLNIAPDLLPTGTALKLLRKICFYAEKPKKRTLEEIRENPDAEAEPIGWVIIKINTFCKWLDGICERHVYRLLAELERLGFIERVPHPGHKTAIYPLVKRWQIPGWQSHAPKPIAARSKPMLEEVPQERQADPNPPKAGEHSAEKHIKNSAAIAGVLAGSIAPSSSITTVKPEKQYGGNKFPRAQNREKRSTDEDLASLPPDAAPVVALMQKCGVWKNKIVHYVNAFGVQTLYDAFCVTLGRVERGTLSAETDDLAGYGLKFARYYKSGEWKLPGWLLKQRGVSERKEEIERARANKVVNTPKQKAPVPPEWLPGISEREARLLLRSAFTAVRAGMKCDPDPMSLAIRDEARALWRRQNPAAQPPWEYTAALKKGES